MEHSQALALASQSPGKAKGIWDLVTHRLCRLVHSHVWDLNFYSKGHLACEENI